ncbi:hypothetical protein AT268_33540 [Bacillus cereus]|uniref:DUF86 domain-containing protein n=1 Tax=Bacillus cereus TaxID=1396 RepID=A0A9X0MKL3_BACCE|nr:MULTISPECIES: DUF86 domain-containing protein [Bacillus cereus group]PEZ74954.1 DUF86 domain-containing protein [Bacillus anthracis]KXY51400.1 hypothetical protein AT268_33540 [Bacillus cereus]PFA29738.1 DUF86 domain-containing protein [Bacillus thuringiensis]PGW13385.1 DUF86 domain-containing protein [Bacillus cereus]SME49290.1 hypothetical protein BACERE00183_04269 [Bacillus cereus]
MLKDYRIIFEGILTEAKDAEEFVEGMSFEEFKNDKKTMKAVIRSLEIIGEAMNRIPKEYQQKHKDISWWAWVKFRNVLIHVYHAIDLDLVWDVLKNEVPPLKRQMDRLLKNPKTSNPKTYKKSNQKTCHKVKA